MLSQTNSTYLVQYYTLQYDMTTFIVTARYAETVKMSRQVTILQSKYINPSRICLVHIFFQNVLSLTFHTVKTVYIIGAINILK